MAKLFGGQVWRVRTRTGSLLGHLGDGLGPHKMQVSGCEGLVYQTEWSGRWPKLPSEEWICSGCRDEG